MDKQTKQIENFLNLVSAHLFREDGANKYMQYLNASAWRWTIEKKDLLYYTFRSQMLSMRSTKCLGIRN